MNRWKRFVPILLAALLLLTSCGTEAVHESTSAQTEPQNSAPAPESSAAPETEAPDTAAPETGAVEKVLTPRDKDQKYNVLFIGNSFTHYNEMNRPKGIFYNIAQKAGYTGVTVSTVYKGGYYLHQFLDPSDSYGKQVLDLLKSNTKYDVVVIQEQSVQPISNPADFYDSVREFNELVKANGGELWLYSTWGYHPKYESTQRFGPTTEEMEMKLRAAYVAIGEELNIPVIYAGAAMTKCYLETKVNVYHTDWKHPSLAGSTLIAWTIFGTVFGVDPATLTYDANLASAVAKTLRGIASDIVNADITVDEKFRVSSEGVHRGESTAVLVTKAPPLNRVISVVYRDSSTVGDGWMTLKTDSSRTFSGIRGDKDAIASLAYSAKALTDAQKADIADIGYGVSVIGIGYMDASKKGVQTSTKAGDFTSVGNLVNGHWGSSYMAAMYFDGQNYDITGKADEDSEYTGLITLNFGKKMKFDSIGYFSGSLKGFAQAQDVYVSDDGVNWTKVPSACYDVMNVSVNSLDTAALPDPWNGNTATVLSLCDMAGAEGKYIRIGIIKGGVIESNSTEFEAINTRELVVFGAES